MALVSRATKGSPLTFDEVDGNFAYLKGLSDALSAALALFEAYTALTSVSGAIAIALSASDNFHHELLEDTVLSLPTDTVPGQEGDIEFKQNHTTAFTVGVNAFWKFPAGVGPAMTATFDAVDVLHYKVNHDGSFAICEWRANIS